MLIQGSPDVISQLAQQGRKAQPFCKQNKTGCKSANGRRPQIINNYVNGSAGSAQQRPDLGRAQAEKALWLRRP